MWIKHWHYYGRGPNTLIFWLKAGTVCELRGDISPARRSLFPPQAKLSANCARAGFYVKAGQALLVLSAMKMETSVSAPVDGWCAD